MLNTQSPTFTRAFLLLGMLVLACSKEGLNLRPAGTGGSPVGGTGGSPVGGAGGSPVGGAGGGPTGSGGWGTGGAAGSGAATGTADSGVPSICRMDGKTYQLGESFKLDCNGCTCTANGIACTDMGCPPGPDAGQDRPADVRPIEDARPISCVLPSSLTFGHNGGMVFYEDEYKLTSSGFTVTRNYRAGPGPDGAPLIVCMPPLPACGAAGVVSVATIAGDMADAEVQAAIYTAKPTGTLYGHDDRPVDGTVYSIAVSGGGTLLVGRQCESPFMSSCRTIPAGLVRFVADLQSLATDMVAEPACGGL